MAHDSRHWRDWLNRHGPALLLFARQWSASQADAQDAMQDGFVKFWRNRAGARDELAYLYSCVRTAAMDQGRSRRRRDAREAAVDRPQPPAFVAPLERAERAAAIEAALSQLPGDQREAVVMKIWGGLTFAQIAAAVNSSPNTVASRYRYALTRLAAELAEETAHD